MIAQASNFVTSVDNAFIFVVAVSVFFLVLITVLMIVFVIKYNRKRHKRAKNIHYNVPLEVTWTLVPTLLVLLMFWVGWEGYKEMSTPPDDAMIVDVTAQMWQWKFKYDNGKESDTLFVPLDKPVQFRLHSTDVAHSFYIPTFRVKKDVYPNRTNTVWFRPEEEGEFVLTCAEYCGLRHSYMLTKVKVVPESSFNAWLKGSGIPNFASGDSSTKNNIEKPDIK